MGNSVVSVDRIDCTGCGACFNVCPAGAIKMIYDPEGFQYPTVDGSLCISCGLCYEKCPSVNPVPFEKKSECFAVMGPDELRMKSSSGGMFSLLAEKILGKGGYVCGAAYSEDFHKVGHIIVNDEDGLARLRGSKYVQSDTGTVFKEIKALLDDKKDVLFSGCPCQVAGLKNYLGKEYKNLLTVDLVCHGGNSLTAYNSFLDECSQGRDIKSVNFREKEVYGWGTPSTITFTDGTVFRQSCDKSPWYKGFLNGVFNRPYCGSCKYASIQRVGDITLGDFWGVSEIDPEFDDNKGTGLVLVNSSKGMKALKAVKSELKLCEAVPLDRVIDIAKTRNGQLLYPRTPHPNRDKFFKEMKGSNFGMAMAHTTDWRYDIGVVGWWYNENYGGILTYYALHQILRSMGLSVLMIEEPSETPEVMPDYDRIARRFAKKYYTISDVIHPHRLGQLNDLCAAFISGSDQLFNPALWEFSGPSYFLDFTRPEKNLISYASSFGDGFRAGDDFRARISYYLHRFNSLSVREDIGVDIMRENFGLEARKVLDPVFVCDPEEYHRLADKSGITVNKEYFASFFLDPCAEKREAILRLKHKLKLPYINLLHASGIEQNTEMLGLDEIKSNLDVEDFLNYYRNARFIITDSFHGTCLAIIFGKPFISVANKQRGAGRFVSMLNAVGLTDRLVYDCNEIYENPRLLDDIDYNEVGERLAPLREQSYEWLRKAVFEPTNKAANPFNVMDIYQYENLLKIFELQEKVFVQQSEIDRLKKDLEYLKNKK